jgi:endonuclease-8
MPEGPEIRREAKALARVLVDRPLLRVEYRVPRLKHRARALRGTNVTDVRSQGKALLIDYSNGLTHYSHNQLYGEWRVISVARLGRLLDERATSVRVLLETSTHAAVLLSATQIELLNAAELAGQPYLKRLGPDVLDRTTTAATVESRLRQPAFARRSLAALLLDQAFLAGLGNYLRSDILHATGLRHTMRPVELSDDALARLADAIVRLPRQSVRTAGTTNDPAIVRTLEAKGIARGARRFRVYDREGLPCWTCGARIRRIDVAGRGIYFCARCQPDESVRRTALT